MLRFARVKNCTTSMAASAATGGLPVDINQPVLAEVADPGQLLNGLLDLLARPGAIEQKVLAVIHEVGRWEVIEGDETSRPL